MKTDILMACDHLAGAALNGLGQGILLVMFVGVCLRVLGPTNAATRHAVWLGTLLLLVALVPAQLWRDRLVRGHGDRVADPPDLQLMSATLASSLAEFNDQPKLAQAPSEEWATADQSSAPASAGNAGLPQPRSDVPQDQSHTAFRAAMKSLRSPGSWRFDLAAAIPRTGGVVLVAVWMAVLGIRMPLLVWRLHGLRKLKKSSLPASDALNQMFRKLHAQLGVTRRVELRVSPRQGSAVVLGFIHSVILFPAGEGHAPDGEGAEHVLRHELGHVRRLDDWANLLQQLIQTALFFHPAVWWVSRRLALEREIACDDIVLRQGGRPQAYALLLVNLAGRRRGCQPMLAPGVSTGQGQLQQRITMILNTHRNTSPRLAMARLGTITSAAVLAGLLVLYASPRLVLAQSLTPPAVQADNPHLQALPPPPPPPAVSLSLVDAAPAVAGSADAETWPKFKPGEAPSAEPAPPAAPRPPRKSRPAVAARPALPEAADRGTGIEERLDRLEQMVKSLVDQQSKRVRGQPELSIQHSEFGQFPNSNNFDRLRLDAKREAARAAEMDKRAARQAEKAAKLEEEWREKGPLPDGYQKQLEGLHQQRDVLQREMEKLQRQIEKVERERERLDEQKRRHADDDGAELKE